MNLKKLKNPQDNIIHITKTRRLALLGMMQPARPINRNIGILSIHLDSSPNTPTSTRLTKLKNPIKNRAIFTNVKPLQAPVISMVDNHVGSNRRQEIDIVVGMETSDVGGGGWEWSDDFHFAMEGVVDDEIVGHADSVGFHWVALAVIVVADCGFVKVCDSAFFAVGGCWEGRAGSRDGGGFDHCCGGGVLGVGERGLGFFYKVLGVIL